MLLENFKKEEDIKFEVGKWMLWVFYCKLGYVKFVDFVSLRLGYIVYY